MSRRRGVLLDVDGTLVDNSYLHAVAWFRALRAHGRVETMARLHRLVGMGGDMYTRELFGEPREDLDKAHGVEAAQFRDDMVALPGAAELVRRIHDAGLMVVLSTSASREAAEDLVAMLGVEQLVDEAATNEDAGATKPAPDLVKVALEKSALQPEDAVFVGDTRWDVEAAGRCGVPCIALETGGWAAQELRDAGAAAVYRDPAEIVARFDDSILAPLANGRRDLS